MTYSIRAVTAQEKAATAAIRFREQYRDWDGGDKFHDGKSKDDVDEVFNTQPHTPEVIAGILNNDWAFPSCMVCGKNFHSAALFREAWGDQELCICLGCLDRARLILAGQNTAEVKP